MSDAPEDRSISSYADYHRGPRVIMCVQTRLTAQNEGLSYDNIHTEYIARSLSLS